MAERTKGNIKIVELNLDVESKNISKRLKLKNMASSRSSVVRAPCTTLFRWG